MFIDFDENLKRLIAYEKKVANYYIVFVILALGMFVYFVSLSVRLSVAVFWTVFPCFS